MARGGVDRPQLVHDRAHHSVANHGQDGFAHRALRDDVHLATRIRERGLHLFQPGNFGNADFRPFRLWLGMSHPRATGFLRVALEENGSASETVSVTAAGVRAAHRRAVHVRLACGVSIDLEPGASAADPEIHQSSGDD